MPEANRCSDCDDCDPTVLFAPREIEGVRIDSDGMGPSTNHDIVRGASSDFVGLERSVKRRSVRRTRDLADRGGCGPESASMLPGSRDYTGS